MNGQAYPECIIQEDKINNCTTSPTIEHNDIIHFLKLPTRTRTISEYFLSPVSPLKLYKLTHFLNCS